MQRSIESVSSKEKKKEKKERKTGRDINRQLWKTAVRLLDFFKKELTSDMFAGMWFKNAIYWLFCFYVRLKDENTLNRLPSTIAEVDQ